MDAQHRTNSANNQKQQRHKPMQFQLAKLKLPFRKMNSS